MVKEYIAEFDATVEYEERDKAIINGVESIYLFNPYSGSNEWIKSDRYKAVFTGRGSIEKPTIFRMLSEFISIYKRLPNELEERLLIEQFEAEFSHWYKNV